MSWDEAVGGVDRDTPGGRAPRAWEVAQRLGLRAANDDTTADDDGLPAYAELHCVSDFSFLRGASDAEALFGRAQRCGYGALAITDECSLAGIVRALEASEATGVPLVVGSEFTLADGLKCVLLVENHAGYTRLCELITVARRSVEKKGYRLARARTWSGYLPQAHEAAGQAPLYVGRATVSWSRACPARHPWRSGVTKSSGASPALRKQGRTHPLPCRPAACSRCGSRARNPILRRAAGCSPCSARARTWRWNCTASRTMPHACSGCWTLPRSWTCRRWPAATCTCPGAASACCRTR